jgi:hypothetical protein
MAGRMKAVDHAPSVTAPSVVTDIVREAMASVAG